MKILKGHLGFVLFFSFVLVLFLWQLIIIKGGFVNADYLQQFYPWSKIYSDSIKNLKFPYWTRYFHSGFPLMAEGQIGGFYPLNILMFFLLPFKVAYNYLVVLHFTLAGVFTYIYARKTGQDQWGGALSALLFCFGSAFAGCFYNIVTLKTLSWFPAVFLFIELFLATKKPIYIVISAVIAGMQFLAGFLQMAAYSLVFYLIYLIYRLIQDRMPIAKVTENFLIFFAVSVVISLPQFLLTYHLAEGSIRANSSLGFALWGSLPPPCFLGIFIPRWMDFKGTNIYIGILSLLFLIYAIIWNRGQRAKGPLILIAAIALLVSLGRYNPLYAGLLKVTRFYSFRNPSKFLFFALFAGSLLTGSGFAGFFACKETRIIKSCAKTFSIILGGALGIFFIYKWALYLFKDQIIKMMQNYVFKYVVGKPYHRYDLKTYMEKVEGLYQLLVKNTSLGDLFVAASIVFILIGLIVGLFIYIKPAKIKALQVPIFCLIFLDIYVYSFYGTGFRGNIKPFSYAEPQEKAIVKILKSDKEFFRMIPFDITDAKLPLWVRPNANALLGLDTIAAYTPLAESDYKQKLISLEVVDDSLGLLSPKENALSENYQLLRILNAKYIISCHKLKENFLKEIASENGVNLYKLDGYLPRAFFTYNIEDDIQKEPIKTLKLLEYRDGYAKICVSTEKEGYLVFSENYYPGWKAYVNGTPADIIKVKDLVQALKIEKGSHEVIFNFKPRFINGK